MSKRSSSGKHPKSSSSQQPNSPSTPSPELPPPIATNKYRRYRIICQRTLYENKFLYFISILSSESTRFNLISYLDLCFGQPFIHPLLQVPYQSSISINFSIDTSGISPIYNLSSTSSLWNTCWKQISLTKEIDLSEDKSKDGSVISSDTRVTIDSWQRHLDSVR